MKQDQLIQLIKDTDKAFGETAPIRINTQAIRQRAAYRRWALRMGSMAAVVIGTVILGFGLWPQSNRPSPPSMAASDTLKQLEAQSNVLLAQVKQLDKINARAHHHQRLGELHRQMAAISDPRQDVRKEISQAARTLVAAADRLLQDPGQRRRARKTYERVIQLFPENNWSHIARKRLLAMNNRSITMKGN
jgi:hypothetical protein